MLHLTYSWLVAKAVAGHRVVVQFWSIRFAEFQNFDTFVTSLANHISRSTSNLGVATEDTLCNEAGILTVSPVLVHSPYNNSSSHQQSFFKLPHDRGLEILVDVGDVTASEFSMLIHLSNQPGTASKTSPTIAGGHTGLKVPESVISSKFAALRQCACVQRKLAPRYTSFLLVELWAPRGKRYQEYNSCWSSAHEKAGTFVDKCSGPEFRG